MGCVTKILGMRILYLLNHNQCTTSKCCSMEYHFYVAFVFILYRGAGIEWHTFQKKKNGLLVIILLLHQLQALHIDKHWLLVD